MTTAGAAKAFERGDQLVRQDEARAQVFILLVGHVRITRIEASGAELTLSVRGPGEVLGDMAAIESEPRRRSATAIALGRCHTRVLSVTDFEAGVDEFRMRKALAGHFADRYREGEQIRAENSLPALQRIAALVCRLAASVGHTVGEDVIIDVGVSQEDLRRAVQLSPSTFGAGIKTLRDLGLLTTARGRLAVHRLEGLRHLAGSGSVER
jgi:CRP/FNR family transcriptional regulator, cyclic AMP receptor protein